MFRGDQKLAREKVGLFFCMRSVVVLAATAMTEEHVTDLVSKSKTTTAPRMILVKNDSDNLLFGLQYPCGSGNWFPVAHESIITEELFNDVQRQLTMEKKKTEWGSKEFAFTRLMKCGACGSGVTAQEKFKSLRDGTRQRYVYYHCGRTTDKDCKEPYVREEALIEQLVSILDELEIDHAVSKKKFQDELERNQRFMASMLGAEATTKMPRLDHKKYLRHVLINGTKEEKRELLSCINSRMCLGDGLLRTMTL